MKNILYVAGILLAAAFAVFIIVLTGINNTDAKLYEEQGKIVIQEESDDNESFAPYIDEEWIIADAEVNEKKPIRVSINDDQNILSQKDFLSTKAHFIKGEAIGQYLYHNGYPCEEVTVVPGSSKKDKNNSSFVLDVTGHPEIQLKVSYHKITEEFIFEIIPVSGQ